MGCGWGVPFCYRAEACVVCYTYARLTQRLKLAEELSSETYWSVVCDSTDPDTNIEPYSRYLCGSITSSWRLLVIHKMEATSLQHFARCRSFMMSQDVRNAPLAGTLLALRVALGRCFRHCEGSTLHHTGAPEHSKELDLGIV